MAKVKAVLKFNKPVDTSVSYRLLASYAYHTNFTGI